MERTALLLEAVAVPAMIAAMGMVSIIAIAGLSGPFVDDALVRLDAGLGFDWQRLFWYHVYYPLIMSVSWFSYHAFYFDIAGFLAIIL